MNYKITVKVVRTASDVTIRKKLNLPADAPVNRREVENFGRMWQTEVATNGEAAGLLECGEMEADVVFQ